jgi:uncharacterized protein (TIGR03437 family)
MLYASAAQVNAIVPYEIQNRVTVQVHIVSTVNGAQVSTPNFAMQTGATAPGIFTVTQNGRGQGAILNQDNSYNGAATPAAKGSIVQVFATGEGIESPDLATGSVTSGTHVPAAKVTAIVNGAPAEVTFAGAAPGAVAGLFQVNVRIPLGAPSGDVPITVSVGGASSQPAVTVAVQ